MRWIWNQRIYDISQFWANIIVSTVEMTIMNICMLLLVVIMQSQNTDWYQQARLAELENDLLFAEKSASVFGVLAIAVFIISLFSGITYLLFIRDYLERIKSQILVFQILGYERVMLQRMIRYGRYFDLLLSFPFVNILSSLLIRMLQQKKEFFLIFNSIGNNQLLFFGTELLCLIFMGKLSDIYEKHWIKKEIKGCLEIRI